MIRKYDLVLFDLDGTLLDTVDDMHGCMAYALRSLGYPERSREEIRSFVGNGIRKLAQRSLPDELQGDDAEVERLMNVYVEYYSAHSMEKTRPFAGIPELIAELNENGVCCGVISNKNDVMTAVMIRHYFGDAFGAVWGKKAEYPRKPDPTSVYALIRAFGCTPERTAYVGDSEVDIRLSENAGIDGLIVSWGFRSHDQLTAQGAKALADDVRQLRDLLLSEKE